MTGPYSLLRQIFDAAIAAAQPDHCLPQHLPSPPRGKLIVTGAGKASAAMAKAVEDHWPGPLSGLVVTRTGHSLACSRIEIIEASHPVPDEAGMAAAKRILHLVQAAGEDDLVLCLMSGGGSALLSLPLPGLQLADKQAVNRALLACGASISEINTVRRHLSSVKGGRLAAAAYPAKVLTLAISDVPGDRLCDIASGPAAGDPTTCRDALAILQRYAISIPAITAVLSRAEAESVKPDDPRLARARTKLIATPQMALMAARDAARKAGMHAHILSDAIEGEAREVAKVMAAVARHSARQHAPFTPPCVLLSGGETTVTVRGPGRGGRNVEFLLALAIALDGAPGIWALAGDSDGIDGSDEIAGAIITPDTLTRAKALNLNPRQALDNNDAHSFFQALGDTVVTGPTRTNVNDIRAILIGNP